MGVVEAEVQPIWRSLQDESGAPPTVDVGGLEGGRDGRRSRRGGGVDRGRDGIRGGGGGGHGDYGYGYDGDGAIGDVSLLEGGGAGTGGLPGGETGGGGHTEGGCPDNQGGL